VAGSADEIRSELREVIEKGKLYEYVPLAGAIKDILPAAEIVRRMVSQAEAAIRQRLTPES
jgi:hypothetical protein